MTVSKLVVIVGLLSVASANTVLMAQTTNPIAGTWELNETKSKMAPGTMPKSQTRTYTVNGQQVRAVHKGIGPDGKPTFIEYTATYDGKDYPYTGSTLYNTIALTRVDAQRCRLYRKKMASRCSRARESFHGMERPSQFLASKPT